MKSRALVLAGVVAACSLNGCATVLNGTSQKVEIVSKPAGAKAVILPSGQVVTTPATVRLARLNAYTVRLTLPGYETETAFLDRVASGAIYGNLILGGMIGMSVDARNGAAFQLIPKKLEVTLRPIETGSAAADSQAPR